MRIGRWIIMERAGATPPPSPAPQPQRERKLSPAEVYRTLMRRRTVVLPISGVEVRLAPPTVRVLVDAGLTVSAMIPVDSASMTEAEAQLHMDRALVQARRLLCASAEYPLFRPHPEDPENIDVDLVPTADLLFVYQHLLDWGSSIFYGTHRADLNLEYASDRDWIDAQQQASATVDQIARRYSMSTEAVEAMSPVAFARLMAFAEAGILAEKDAIKEAQNK